MSVTSSLNELMKIDGALGGCIVDYTSGMTLGTVGTGVDFDLAAAGNSEVVKAKLSTMESLGIKGSIDDILITLEHQLHVIRPTAQHENLFLYLVLDKAKANLALARRKVKDLEATITV